MELDKLKAVLSLCSQYGLKRIKLNEIEIEFGDKIIQDQKPQDIGIQAERMPTDDELLLWSSGVDVEVEAPPHKEP